MTDKTILQLPESTEINSDDLLILENVQQGITTSVKANLLKEPYVVINSIDSLPTATGYNAVAIGPDSHSPDSTGVSIGYYNLAGNSCVSIGTFCDTGSTTSSIAIGREANAGSPTSEGSNNIALGTNAVVFSNNSIQLGSGTNTTESTLQFQTNTIANNVGIQVRTGAGAPTLTAADGTLYVDTSGLKLYFRAGGQWIAAN